MGVWTTTVVNGALADSLISDFGAALSPNTRLGQDGELCLVFHYSSSAASQVQLYLATAAGATAANLVMIYDSAFQTNPAANSTQYLTNVCVTIPLASGTLVPMQFRITKANTTANVRWKITPKMGPTC